MLGRPSVGRSAQARPISRIAGVGNFNIPVSTRREGGRDLGEGRFLLQRVGP